MEEEEEEEEEAPTNFDIQAKLNLNRSGQVLASNSSRFTHVSPARIFPRMLPDHNKSCQRQCNILRCVAPRSCQDRVKILGRSCHDKIFLRSRQEIQLGRGKFGSVDSHNSLHSPCCSTQQTQCSLPLPTAG